MNITKISTASFEGILIRGNIPPSNTLVIKMEEIDELIKDLKIIKGVD